MEKGEPQHFADPALLEKIDQLFACGVGELVALPQLVVVGDQSSGKSSVLEGLTKLPFPRDSVLCTRFATQITFRRGNEDKISAYIIPDSHASDEHKAHVKSWASPPLTVPLDPKEFARVVLEAQTQMGLNQADATGSQTNFSEDVLRIEISGPQQEHFSIVDVPGIFRNTEEGKTTEEDKKMVNRIVRSHMENPRSVMLAVVAANTDIANQGILTMARNVDARGIRTLGVLTKPDLVDRGAEEPILGLMNGSRQRLTLGWHIVRNTGQGDLKKQGHDRDAEELRFFRDETRWRSLPSAKCGVGKLREQLQNILAQHIRREFPKVRAEIVAKLKKARSDIEVLGVQRSTPHEQRAYLIKIANDYERITTEAVHSRYMDPRFDKHKTELRLPTRIVSRQEEFAKLMAKSGHNFSFDRGDSSKGYESEGSVDEEEYDDEPRNHSHNQPSAGGLSSEEETSGSHADADVIQLVHSVATVRTVHGFVDLGDRTISADTTIYRKPQKGIIGWLTREYNASRGFELGGIDPSLLTTAFRGLSIKWDDISKGYISDIIELVNLFIFKLLELVVVDERVREALLSLLTDDLHARYHTAFGSVQFLLKVERESIPMTANHYFADNLRKARAERQNKVADAYSFNVKGSEGQARKAVYVSDLSHLDSMSNDELVIRDFHDVLKAYYKVARKRFVDSVTNQAALFHLVASPDSPLKLFSSSYVGQMSDAQLEEIAGEDQMTKSQRLDLQREIKMLEDGKKVL